MDHDGRLEIVLKNRTAPQMRILRNAMSEIGGSIAFRLQGTKSNRDAIGAAVTLEAGGLKQTKLLQAGSGFLSQHSKELFFGIGKAAGPVRASVRWPSGLTQTFEGLPANHRVEIKEGAKEFVTTAFEKAAAIYSKPTEPLPVKNLPDGVETWLIQPLQAPDFSLPDLSGAAQQLSGLRGQIVLLQLWGTTSAESVSQLKSLQKLRESPSKQGVQILCVNVDDPLDVEAIRMIVAREKLSIPVLLANEDAAGIYNIFYRYLFDRRRDLGLPTAFLLNRDGKAVKVYQGAFAPERVLEDILVIPETPADLVRMALPMKGTAYLTSFQRNDFTYGVAFFQRGYLEAATASFQQVIAAKPDNPEAYYNLGTLYLTKGDLAQARENLEQGGEVAARVRGGLEQSGNGIGATGPRGGSD